MLIAADWCVSNQVLSPILSCTGLITDGSEAEKNRQVSVYWLGGSLVTPEVARCKSSLAGFAFN